MKQRFYNNVQQEGYNGMGKRENEHRAANLRFNGKEIQLAVKMLDELETTIDIIYYLMEQEKEQAFVLMLVTAKEIDLDTLLNNQKRETDILFEIDKEEAIYAMLCQDTKVDGGYHFAERVIRNIQLDQGKDIYCTELEVRATHYSPKHVVLKLLETFVKSRLTNKSNEIVFRSLN